MFTPPTSPQPATLIFKEGTSSSTREGSPVSPQRSHKGASGSTATSEYRTREDQKRRTGRRFRLAVLLVPLVLIAITATARVLTSYEHSDWDLHSLSSSLWRSEKQVLRNGFLHRRQDASSNDDDNSSSPSSTRSSTSSAPSSSSSTPPPNPSAVPTVPSTPPTLPTPFLQPFDGSYSQNFSSQSCANFFREMTNAQQFRSCRPFSLLLQTSNDFISAQQNITFLNEIIWGTCNTNTDESQCLTTMASYANSLRVQCEADLKDSNSMAVNTLIALEAYGPMREAACLSDPTTNTYCFVNAARASTADNLYYYSLPLGTSLPSNTDPQCTACLKSLMSVYSTALKDTAETPSKLSGLVETYESAAELTLGKCGVGYALTGVAGSADGLWGPSWERRVLVAVVSVVTATLVHGVL